MLTVSEASWHYKIYRHWRENIARNPPMTINLCHYMRAIMLFTPGYYVGLGLLYAAIGLAIIVAGAFVVVTSPLWGPVWLVTHNKSWHKRGARRVGNGIGNGVRAAAVWMENGGQWVMLGLLAAALVAGVGVIIQHVGAGAVAKFVLAVVAGIAVSVALVAALAWLIDRWWNDPDRKRNRKLKRDRKIQEYMDNLGKPKPPKEPGWLSLCWSFLKAKKKRICPLIQVNERRTT